MRSTARLIAFPISNTGIVEAARPAEISSSLVWKVPRSISKTSSERPGRYTAMRVSAVVTTNAPHEHPVHVLNILLEKMEPVRERILIAHIISAKLTVRNAMDIAFMQ